MIGSLRGVLLDRTVQSDQPSGEVLVEVAGVGYRLIVPAGTLSRLGEIGAAVFLHVHTHVRDDAIVLYGFATRDERACFEMLIGAHGVGPAVALALLSVHSPSGLRRAVSADDLGALMLVPGVGRKTAARLLIELKARLDLELDRTDVAVVGATMPEGTGVDNRLRDVRAALAGLGYGHDEVREVLTGLPPDGVVEDLLRAALRQLAGSR